VVEGRTGDPAGRADPLAPGRSPRLLVWALLSLLIASSFAWVGGGLPTPKTNVGVAVGVGNARGPSLAVDTSGTLHLVHSDDVAGDSGVYYRRSSDGAAWAAPTRIDVPGSFSYFPRIAIEREAVPIRGRLYVAYQLGTGSAADIWFTASDDGVLWSPQRRIDTAPVGVTSTGAAIAASEGRVFLTWSDNRDGTTYQLFFRSSSDGGATWGAEIPLSSTGVSNLQSRVEAKGDTVVASWRRADPSGTAIVSVRSEDAGSTWTFSTVAFGPSVTDNVQDPDLFLDDLGVAHVAWVYQQASGEAHILYAWSADGLNWSSPVTVDDMAAAAFARTPSIGGVAGTLWIAWADQRGGDYDVFASWSPDGATWGDGLRNGNDLRVDDTDRNAVTTDDATNQVNPIVETGGFGVFAAWEDFRSGSTWDAYFSGVDVSPLVITEIQDEPASMAQIEVYNFAPTPFSLAGVSLYAGNTVVDLSPLGSAPARGYVVVGAPATADLRASLDMGSEGARVELRRGTEVLASAGSGIRGIAPDPLPSESTARYAGTLDYTVAWTRGTLPSFGARNLVMPPDTGPALMLNEVLFHPANPGERFVELYLRGIPLLDLTGYRLVSDGVYTFSGVVITSSNPYTFLFEGRAPAWFGPLDETGDNVYLYDPAGRLLDMVGWTTPHAVGMSVVRVAPGVGGVRAYDDPSATANGWAFDQAPTLALVDLAQDARLMADIGTTAQFVLRATNLQAASEYVNVGADAAQPWPIAFRWTNGTPLSDSPGDPDGLPDLGDVPPGATVPFLVEVTIPVEGNIGDSNRITASASAASVPVGRDTAILEVALYPHFDTMRTVDPSPVYLEGSGPPWNEIAQITVTVKGAGYPVVEEIPQDVIFQLDVSGSMSTSDPTNLRVDAVQAYIDGMRVSDRASVIGFNSIAWVVANRPLTYTDPPGKVLLKGDADTLRFANGATNIDAALQLGNDWLITYGTDPTRARVEILLTDGVCTVGIPPCPNTNNLINQAVAEGIVIYTIGLNVSGGVDRPYLENIATRTGGKYYEATTAQDLLWIYKEIGTRINRTAGVDPDLADNIPLIEDDAAPYLTVLANSFYDPATGAPRPPSSITPMGDRTRIQWSVPRILINETWSVRYSVTSTRLGVQDVALHPDARVAYRRWDGSSVFQTIPQGTLEVLAPPTPPRITTTNPTDGTTNVPLDQPISVVFSEAMDGPTVQWTIAPVVAVTPAWSTSQVLVLIHAGLTECTEYTVEITAGLDTDGESLVPGPVPNPWTFRTVCPTYVRYTITRIPVRGDVIVDGVAFAAPAVFTWRSGDVHRIEGIDLDNVGASRFAFLSWDDGGARDHAITVGTADATITARYALQHTAVVTLVGLSPPHPASVRFTLFGSGSGASSSSTWSDWVDDRTTVDVDDLLTIGAAERYITLDRTEWTATGPLNERVAYHHQYDATVRLVGLETHDIEVDSTAFGRPAKNPADVSWNAWVDAGSQVRVPDELATAMRERYRTLDVVRWTVDAPLDATVVYRHQFRPHVRLIGLNDSHTVGAAWRIDGGPQTTVGLFEEWFAWADAGTTLVFDGESTGRPALRALDPTSFAVSSPFDATIRYAAAAPPPPENWKPMLAFAYTIGLLAAGAVLSRKSLDYYVPAPKDGGGEARRRAWANLPVGRKFAQLSLAEVEEKVARDRRVTRILLLVPFATVEGAIGLLSHLTGLLRIPDAGSWLPVGFWVNTAILAAGLVVGGAIHRQGYRMTDDALLRLAAVREKASRTSPPEK